MRSHSTNGAFKVTGKFSGESQTGSVGCVCCPVHCTTVFLMLLLAALSLWGHWTLCPCHMICICLDSTGSCGALGRQKSPFPQTASGLDQDLCHPTITSKWLHGTCEVSNYLSSGRWKPLEWKPLLLSGLPIPAFQHYFQKCVTWVSGCNNSFFLTLKVLFLLGG